MVRAGVSTGNPIPLTLPLSHREREQPAASSIVRTALPGDTALRRAGRLRRIPPLPEGEGRGEGKREARCANRLGTSPEGPYGFEPFILSCLQFCRRSLTEK